MIEWGISANSHNAALAVFKNDELVFASESERFSRIKNDPHLNIDLIDYASQFGRPEKIYWYENPYLKTARQFIAGQGWLLSENKVNNYLKSFGIYQHVKFLNHHKSHAAAGYYTSTFRDACIITIDSIGEFETLTICHGSGNRIEKIYSQSYPHSIGLWYSAMTQRIGLKPNEEEYILMGMSALGDPARLYDDIKEDFIQYTWPRFVTFKRNLHRGCKDWRPDLVSQQDIYDIAAATQKIYEEVFQNLLFYAKHISKSKNLVLMGGCALNCVANTKAWNFFDDIWIMPAPGDNGSSIGCVLAAKKEFIDWPGVYLGYDLGYGVNDDEIVDYLIGKKMCGLARGKAEFGPRSLGNRSLLADPRGKDIKSLVNSVKQREQFRPFAPAILEEFAKDYFEMPSEKTPYMQYAVRCLRPKEFPAIVHIDGTSRVQTVSEKDNPGFYSLLKKWYAKTGCPMLLNTSLNIKGEPIVNDLNDIVKWQNNHNVRIFT